MSEIALVTRALDIPGRCVGLELVRLYKLALKTPQGLPMVELGTFQGRTTAVLCGAAQSTDSEVVTIDNYTQDPVFVAGRPPLPGEPEPHRLSEEYAELTRQTWRSWAFSHA